MLKKLGIGAAAVIVIFFVFNSVIMPWYVKHTDTAKVPSVVGLNFIEAKKVLEDAGFEIKQGDVKYDESKPIGQVLEK
jgi:beta-lactam-binding protein with PASTA domain